MSRENRFRGRTPGEAMRKAKDELGPDVRLVGARRVSAPDMPPVYEVRVKGGPTELTVAQPREGSELDTLRHEIESLKEALTSLQGGAPSTPEPVEIPEEEVVPVATVAEEPRTPAEPVFEVALDEEPEPQESMEAPDFVPMTARDWSQPMDTEMVTAESLVQETAVASNVGAEAGASASAEGPSEGMRSRMESLRAEPTTTPEPVAASGEVRQWAEKLEVRGVGRTHAMELAEEALSRAALRSSDPFESLAQVVRERLGDENPRFGMTNTIFVGPSGAGKTSCLSKLAAEAVAMGRHPILVTTDGESLAGEDTVQAIAESLELTFETAFLPGQMETIVERHGADATYFVDTAGRTPLEPEGIANLKRLLRGLPDADVVLVLPATIDGREAHAVSEGFAELDIDSLLLTKLDELHRPGRILDFVRNLEHRVARVSFGRAIRASSTASDARVVTRILGGARSVEATA